MQFDFGRLDAAAGYLSRATHAIRASRQQAARALGLTIAARGLKQAVERDGVNPRHVYPLAVPRARVGQQETVKVVSDGRTWFLSEFRANDDGAAHEGR